MPAPASTVFVLPRTYAELRRTVADTLAQAQQTAEETSIAACNA